jgi:N-formylglutamate deformylase
MKPFFISIPHSGERVPAEADWLQGLPEVVLMCDVDRFVDRLYQPVLSELKLPFVKTEWHRYVIDLNRLPDDVDANSVEGSSNPAGSFTTGLHWVKTTRGTRLMPKPISRALHDQLVKEYFKPFHEDVRNVYRSLKAKGVAKVYHLDAHSMPSKGTNAHRDPGETRKSIVVSDWEGRSCEPAFKDLVIKAYAQAGFEVGYNWPYLGGRVTQTYGRPDIGQHAIQVEISRALYMDEDSKQIVPEKAQALSRQLGDAVRYIYQHIDKL